MSNARNIASGAKFVETAGDTMTGDLAITKSDASITPDADADDFVIEGNQAIGMTIGSSASSVGSIRFADSGSPRAGMLYYSHITNEMRLYTNATQHLTVNSSGHVTTPSQPAFGIKMNAVSGINATSSTIVIAGSAYFNSSSLQQTGGSNFAVGTGRFTAPVSGFYQFNVSIRFDGHSGNYIYITLVDNGAAISRNLTSLGFTYMTLSMSKAHYLHANDYVEIHINCSADTSVVLDGDSYFSGYLIG